MKLFQLFAKVTSLLLAMFVFFGAESFAKNKENPLKILVNAGPDKTICQGDSTTLTASGAVSYSWTPAASLSDPAIASPFAFPTTNTTYIVFGTDANGNVTNDTVKVFVNIPPAVNAGIDTSFCEGAASVQLFAQVAGLVNAYSWYPSTGLNASNIQNPTATPDTTTLYTVMITDLNGCTSFGDRLVSVLPNNVTSISDTSLCTNDTLKLYAAGGLSYLWQPGTALTNPADSTQANASIVLLNDTIIHLVVVDSFGCIINKNIQVTSKPIPPVYAGIDTVMLCRDSVWLSAVSIPTVTYTWIPGEFTDNPFSPNTWGRPWQTGDFTIMVVDTVTGCRNYDSRNVILSDHFLTVNIVNNDTVLCSGKTLPLLATTSHPVVLYAWSSPSGTFDNISINNPVFTPLNNTTALIIVKDSLECKVSDIINVSLDPFRVQTLPDTNICFGTTIILSTNGGAQFAWSPSIGIDNPTSPAPISNPSATTTYYVQTIDALGCYSYDTVTVTVRPRPVANAGNDREICAGDSLQLQAYGGDSYIWSPATGLNNAFISNPKASPSSVTSYVVTAYNQWGCSDQDLMQLSVRTVPIITYGTDAAICQYQSTPLFASGALNYAWSPVTGLSNAGIANPIASPLQNITYRVIGTTEYGCADTGFVTIAVTEVPDAQIVGYNGMCEGKSVTLSVNEGSAYLWNTGANTSSITVSPTVSTWFTCQSSNGACAGKIDSFWVEVWKNPVADFTFTQFTQFAPIPITFTNASQLATTYTWDFGMEEAFDYAENPEHNFPFAGDFTVTLVAESHKGCTDTISKSLSLINANMFVPSAFTPNAETDNVNSTFKIGSYGLMKFYIRIEGRNGQLAYESEDPNFEWDGKIKGQAAPEGVYVYKIEAMAESGKKFQQYGTVTLIR